MTRPNPADRPPTKHSSLVIDLDLALAARTAEIRQREAQLAAMVAEGYFVQRAPVVDWRDRLLDDVLRGQESP